jgi:glycosyltransferase involved in cell wall biosynthesis
MRILVDGQTLSTLDKTRGIGEYLHNILAQMVRTKDAGVELYLAVFQDYDPVPVEAFASDVRLVSLGKRLETGARASRAYTEGITRAIKEHDIDILWIPNPLMLNVNLLEDRVPCRTVVTVHDLIPLMMKNLYLARWPRDLSREYLRRVKRLDSIADFFLPISEYTGRELARELKVPPGKMRVVCLGSKIYDVAAADDPGLKRKYGSGRFILYLGGFDPRKNMENTVIAFKKLVDEHKVAELDLIITCYCSESDRIKFGDYLKGLHIDDRVRLTGYIPEPELLWLYDHASIFFYPSLCEGFGLPVLEAMSRGVPVVASDRTSLPEVIGDAGLLVDPDRPDEMARALYSVLSDDKLSRQLRSRGRERSRQFSWERASNKVLGVFRRLQGQDSPQCDNKALRIAYFSPLPPQKSGVAVYSRELLSQLGRFATIELFVDDGVRPEPEIRDHFLWHSYRDYEKLQEKEPYDVTIYHIGNNVIHEYIYRTLLKHRGIVVLHDYVLHPFLQHITLQKGDRSAYVAEMKYSYGPEGEKMARAYADASYPFADFLKHPLNERVIDSGGCVVVHSNFVRDMIKRGDVRVIPHGRDLAGEDEKQVLEIKNELGLGGSWPVLGCYGFMSRNRRLEVLVEVFGRIIPGYPDAKLLLAGDLDAGYKKSIVALVRKLNLSDRVIFGGYADDGSYRKYLACADVVVNLRWPTMGETSGTLLDALAFGKPVIVSDVGSYREFPDDCCWKVGVNGHEKELLEAYINELLKNGPLREKMGKNARAYIYENHRWEKVAGEYYKLIREYMSDNRT